MEAAYFALAILPTFATKYPVGWFTGWLLTNYVPECEDAKDSYHDFCQEEVVLGGNLTCFSPNVCERMSKPRDGDPCVCDLYKAGECNYQCHGVVARDGVCPELCTDLPEYTASPEAMWLICKDSDAVSI